MLFRLLHTTPAAQIEHVLSIPTVSVENEICAICRDNISDPRSAAYNHVFCKLCITAHLGTFDDCPLCRTKLFRANLATPSAQIDNALWHPRAGTVHRDEKCTLCRDTIYDARSVACSHAFCKMCIRAHLATFDACPTCHVGLFDAMSPLKTRLRPILEPKRLWRAFYYSMWFPTAATGLLLGLVWIVARELAMAISGVALLTFLIDKTIGIETIAQHWPAWLVIDILSFYDITILSALQMGVMLPSIAVWDQLKPLISRDALQEDGLRGVATMVVNSLEGLARMFTCCFVVTCLSLFALWMRPLPGQDENEAPPAEVAVIPGKPRRVV